MFKSDFLSWLLKNFYKRMLPLSGVCSLFIGGCDPVRSINFRGIYGLIYPKSLRGLFFLRWMLTHSGVCSLYAGGCGPMRYCSCIDDWNIYVWLISRKVLLTSDVVFLYDFYMTEIRISEQKRNICTIINVSCFLLFILIHSL